jgi:hypothetical protein
MKPNNEQAKPYKPAAPGAVQTPRPPAHELVLQAAETVRRAAEEAPQ